MQRNDTSSATLGEALGGARKSGGLGVPAGISIRELARRADVSAAQISRIESGEVLKPSREILVALARALNRNPLPLLILAGHVAGEDARRSLLRLFRDGAELPAEWGDWATFPFDELRERLSQAQTPDDDIRLIAADVFSVAETAETLWTEADQLAAARGEEGSVLRDVIGILRAVHGERREHWLAIGRALERLEDLEYLGESRRLDADASGGAR
jgi:transcriptional regulator with XRE-family HTH domain